MNALLAVMTALSVEMLLVVPAAAEDAPAETMVPIKVLVMIKETVKENPKPFPDVGGFVIQRNRDELKSASCPDTSNEKGELTCRLKCRKDDPDLRLQVIAPLKSQAPIVAGMSPPPAQTISVENCLVKASPAGTPAPVRLIYRTVLAMAEELRSDAPEVFAAVAVPGTGSLQFKSLQEAAPALQQLAKEPANRQKLERLAELSEVYKEAVQAGRGAPMSVVLSEYASGAKSIVLQAAVNDAMGERAKALVKVSPKFEDFDRSSRTVARILNEKPVLSAKEIALERNVKALKGSKQAD